MPRTKLIAFVSGLYIPLLFLGLLMPRHASKEIQPMGLFERILRDILFLTGPPEIILNFLLFVPFFLAILFLTPALSRTWVALISCLTSVTVELAQSQIPGRVSSLRDIGSNCVGVLVALVIVSARTRKRTI